MFKRQKTEKKKKRSCIIVEVKILKFVQWLNDGVFMEDIEFENPNFISKSSKKTRVQTTRI